MKLRDRKSYKEIPAEDEPRVRDAVKELEINDRDTVLSINLPAREMLVFRASDVQELRSSYPGAWYG